MEARTSEGVSSDEGESEEVGGVETEDCRGVGEVCQSDGEEGGGEGKGGEREDGG